MALIGKMVAQITIKSNGDVFHELFRAKPHQLTSICPDKIHRTELHEGNWGKVGSIISFNYTHDGKKKFAKDILEVIDEEKKLVTYKVIEGDMMELYKTMRIMVHVETHGLNNTVTWTLEYEKLNEEIPEPTSLLDLLLSITKDVQNHHFSQAAAAAGAARP